MKIKLSSLPFYLEACRELCAHPLPLRCASKAVKASEKLGRAAREFVREERELKEKYLEKEPDGSLKIRYGTYVFDESREEEYKRELKELLDKEIDLELPSFGENELCDIRLTPGAYTVLLPLIEKGENR